MMEAKQNKPVSLTEFRAIDQSDGYRYELIDGQVHMQARPNLKHQQIQTAMASELYIYLKGKPCNIVTEAEVRIKDNIVVPDIFVYCDENVDGQTYEGIPLIVIEILSDSTRFVDYNKKMRLYESHGVSEYWIINPKLKSISVYDFTESRSYEYVVGDIFESEHLENFSLALESVF